MGPISRRRGGQVGVRHLTDEEKQNRIDPVVDTGSQTVYRMRLKRDDFAKKGFH